MVCLHNLQGKKKSCLSLSVPLHTNRCKILKPTHPVTTAPKQSRFIGMGSPVGAVNCGKTSKANKLASNQSIAKKGNFIGQEALFRHLFFSYDVDNPVAKVIQRRRVVCVSASFLHLSTSVRLDLFLLVQSFYNTMPTTQHLRSFCFNSCSPSAGRISFGSFHLLLAISFTLRASLPMRFAFSRNSSGMSSPAIGRLTEKQAKLTQQTESVGPVTMTSVPSFKSSTPLIIQVLC